MEEEKKEDIVAPPERLCSEIQLFDLCDLESCRYRKGRYCTDERLLAKFEAIREEDMRDSLLYEDDEMEDEDDLEFNELDEDYGDYEEED